MRKLRTLKSMLLMVVCSGVFVSGTFAATTWKTPGTSSGWNTGANWDSGVVPQNTDVIIDGETSSASTVDVDTNVTVHNLTVNSGDTLLVDKDGSDITFAGTNAPVIVDNHGTIKLDGASGTRTYFVEGDVTWTNNGIACVGSWTASHFQSWIQSGATLTISKGTTFNSLLTAYCFGTLVNHGTYKITGDWSVFYGTTSSQVNDGIMDLSGNAGLNLINYIGSNQGDLTLRSINLGQTITIDGGVIHFAGNNGRMYRGGMGWMAYLNGTNTTDLETGAKLTMIRRSELVLDAAGSYTFDGSLIMDAASASLNSHVNTLDSDCRLKAKNGTVTLGGTGSISMASGILTHPTAGDLLRHSIISGVDSNDTMILSLTGGITGAGKIGNDKCSIVNNTLIDATNDTYGIEFDPTDTGSISNSASGTIRASGQAGLLFQDGTFVNAGTVSVMPNSQAVFTNGVSFDNSNGTLQFSLGASSNATPTLTVYGDITLNGTLAVEVLGDYDGTATDRYDVITCTGTVVNAGITITTLTPGYNFTIFDDGTSDGTVTIGIAPPQGTTITIR